MKVNINFQLILTFFGLRPQYKITVLDTIWQLIKYTNGGLDFNTLYHMPVHMRNYFVSKLVKEIEELESKQNNLKSSSNNSKRKVSRPNIPPK